MKVYLSNLVSMGTLFLLLGTGLSSLRAENDWFYNEPQDTWYHEPEPPAPAPLYSITADALLWTAIQGDLDYATTDASFFGALVNAKNQFIDFDGKAGFRIAIKVPLDFLELEGIYTYWHPTHSIGCRAPLNGVVHATMFPGYVDTNFFFAGSAQAHLSLNYILCDLLLADTYNCKYNITARPYVGLRVFSFKESIRTNYEGIDFTPGDFANWKVDLTAGGITLGVKAARPLIFNFNLHGHLGASLLGGEQKQHYQWFKAGPVFQVFPSFQNLSNTDNILIAEWDASIGLAYDISYCQIPISFVLGYELQDWWNMPHMRRFSFLAVSTSEQSGRLTVHGGFFRIAISF